MMTKKRYKWIVAFLLIALLTGIFIGHRLNERKQMIESNTPSVVNEGKTPALQKIETPGRKRDQFATTVKDKHEKIVTNFVENELKNDGFIGTALIIKNGKVIFQKGYGYAERLENKKNSPNSLFQIGSVQKGATGVMLMKLVQEGRVSLNDKLSKYFPSIGYGSLVTLREMLNMISGISLKSLPVKAMSQDQFVKYDVKNVRVNPKNIGKQNYEPANFVLLAGIIQKVTKRSYYDEFRRMIQKPLGLRNTYFFNDYYKLTDGRTIAYSSGNKRDYRLPVSEKGYQYTNELGTGNLYMTNGDLYKMLRAFITGGVLNAKYTTELYTVFPPNNTYSSGLYHLKYMEPFNSLGIHNGYHFHGIEYGYETIGDISADGQQAVILQTNNSNANRPFNIAFDSKLYHFLLAH